MSVQPYIISASLTGELDSKQSPMRKFLDERFGAGLRDVQRRYREAAPDLAVPSVPQTEASPGTIGTAADWLLRFMLCPRPDVHLASPRHSPAQLRAAPQTRSC